MKTWYASLRYKNFIQQKCCIISFPGPPNLITACLPACLMLCPSIKGRINESTPKGEMSQRKPCANASHPPKTLRAATWLGRGE